MPGRNHHSVAVIRDAATSPAILGRPERRVVTVSQKFSRFALVSRLVRDDEVEVPGEEQAEVDTYFDRDINEPGRSCSRADYPDLLDRLLDATPAETRPEPSLFL